MPRDSDPLSAAARMLNGYPECRKQLAQMLTPEAKVALGSELLTMNDLTTLLTRLKISRDQLRLVLRSIEQLYRETMTSIRWDGLNAQADTLPTDQLQRLLRAWDLREMYPRADRPSRYDAYRAAYELYRRGVIDHAAMRERFWR